MSPAPVVDWKSIVWDSRIAALATRHNADIATRVVGSIVAESRDNTSCRHMSRFIPSAVNEHTTPKRSVADVELSAPRTTRPVVTDSILALGGIHTVVSLF